MPCLRGAPPAPTRDFDENGNVITDDDGGAQPTTQPYHQQTALARHHQDWGLRAAGFHPISLRMLHRIANTRRLGCVPTRIAVCLATCLGSAARDLC